jgi:hypothetical protein
VELTAVFESWHLGDGNYPPLSTGMLVNLSFEMHFANLKPAPPGRTAFVHSGRGLHVVTATVLNRYEKSLDLPLVVLEADGFRFYTFGRAVEKLEPGARISGTGMLYLDHYAWVENLRRFPDPPDLFYDLRVARIQAVSIPEQFISRQPPLGMGYPSSLEPDQYSDREVTTVMSMAHQRGSGPRFESSRPVFWLVDFSDAGVPRGLPKTFIGA